MQNSRLLNVPRILIVDDEAGIRSLLAIVFARAGYEVRTAPDAVQAIDLCASEFFEVVLSDVVMPKVDGHDLARWIAKNRPAVQCVLMTAASIECAGCPIVSRCKVLVKPFKPEDAIAAIDQALHRPAK